MNTHFTISTFSTTMRRLIVIVPLLLSNSLMLNAIDVSPEEYQIIQSYEELKEKDSKKAEDFLCQSISTLRTPSLLYQAALLELDKNRISKAAELLNEVIALDNTFPRAHLNRGRINLILGNDIAGVNDLLEGIKIDGADVHTLKILGTSYLKLDQWIAGEQVLRWALLTEPGDPELHIQLAYNLLQQNRYQEAEKVALLAIRNGSQDINAWTLRVHSALENNNTNKAIDILEETRLYHDNLPDDYLWLLGELYLREGLIREASNVFRESHQKKPLRSKKLVAFLETLISLEQIDELEELSSYFREEEPNNAKAIYYCAYACQLKGELNNATAFAKKATELNSGYGKAYILLGKLYAKANKSQEAINNFRIARSFSNVKIQALRLELELWMQDEKWAEALEILDMLSQIDTDNSWGGLISSIANYIERN